MPAERPMSPYKIYVDVAADFSREGKMKPLWVTWEDGRRYMIDRVKQVQRAASLKAGGVGMRYTCMTCGREVHLYYEGEGRWFVEKK